MHQINDWKESKEKGNSQDNFFKSINESYAITQFILDVINLLKEIE